METTVDKAALRKALALARAGLDPVQKAAWNRSIGERVLAWWQAAAVALEMSWLNLVSELGCLSDEQQERGAAGARDYTTELQQSLAQAGYYADDVDGVYGPATVEACGAGQS